MALWMGAMAPSVAAEDARMKIALERFREAARSGDFRKAREWLDMAIATGAEPADVRGPERERLGRFEAPLDIRASILDGAGTAEGSVRAVVWWKRGLASDRLFVEGREHAARPSPTGGGVVLEVEGGVIRLEVRSDDIVRWRWSDRAKPVETAASARKTYWLAIEFEPIPALEEGKTYELALRAMNLGAYPMASVDIRVHSYTSAFEIAGPAEWSLPTLDPGEVARYRFSGRVTDVGSIHVAVNARDEQGWVACGARFQYWTGTSASGAVRSTRQGSAEIDLAGRPSLGAGPILFVGESIDATARFRSEGSSETDDIRIQARGVGGVTVERRQTYGSQFEDMRWAKDWSHGDRLSEAVAPGETVEHALRVTAIEPGSARVSASATDGVGWVAAGAVAKLRVTWLPKIVGTLRAAEASSEAPEDVLAYEMRLRALGAATRGHVLVYPTRIELAAPAGYGFWNEKALTSMRWQEDVDIHAREGATLRVYLRRLAPKQVKPSAPEISGVIRSRRGFQLGEFKVLPDSTADDR